MNGRSVSGVRVRLLVALSILLLAGGVSAQVAGPFTFLGPTGLGGRVRAIVFHPTDPNVAWLGAAGGGVFKTTNGGASWFATGDGLTNLAVTTLVVNPLDPNILYAGTGDYGYLTRGELPGNGIHKSTDGGATWTHLLSTNTSDYRYTWEIALNPAQPSHLYAATARGIFRSTDSGASFQKVYGTGAGADCRDIAVKPGSAAADVVVAGCLSTSAGPAIVRNADAAGTGSWAVVHTEASQERTNLAFAPSAPSIVYALVADQGTGIEQQAPMLAVLKSTDSGATWTAVARQDGNPALMKNHLLSRAFTSNVPNCIGAGEAFIWGEGHTKNALAVDPVNANRLYAGGMDLFRSTDGGVTWGLASNSQFVSSGGNMRPGHYAIAFPAGYNGTTSQAMWIANDTGVYKTNGAVSSATTNDPCVAPTSFAFASRNSGLAAAMLEDGDVRPGGTTYFGASRSHGVVKGTETAGPTGWTSTDTAETTEVMVDPDNPMVLYRRVVRLQKSVDGGATWSNIATNVILNTGPRPGSAMDPSSSARLWTGGGGQIFRSMNSGASWQEASTVSDGWGYTNVVVAPSDPNRVAAVGITRNAFAEVWTTTSALTANASTEWTRSYPPALTLRRHAMAIDPADPQVILLADEVHGVLRSPDFGATWGPLGNGFTAPAVTAILIDPAAPGRVFAGTEAGLYSTSDGGLNWVVESGIPRAYISRLRLDGRKLFAFTIGRGAWRAELPTCTPPPAPASLTATATSTSAVSLSWSAAAGATQYEIHRRSGNGAFVLLKTVSGTSATDTALAANTTYVYKVRGVCGAFSPLDAATTTPFSNDPLTAGSPIRATHITQLRTAVNAMRAAGGLGAATYSDSIAAGSLIRRRQVTELRAALSEARAAIGLPALSFTDATLTSGVTRFRAVHITDLRNGAK